MFNIITAARSPQTLQPAGQPQGIWSALSRTGRLVRVFAGSFIESLNPAHLTEEQKQQGKGYIDPPSFSFQPVTLAMRTISACSPQSSALVGFLLWALPRVAGNLIEVDSADTLSRIGKDPDLPLDGHYQQTADIDARNVSSIRFFAGVYHGRVLSNLRNSLFVDIEDAWVNGTVIRDARITDCVKSERYSAPWRHLRHGFITGTSTRSNFTNNRIEYSALLANSRGATITGGSLCGFCINSHFFNNTIREVVIHINADTGFTGSMAGWLEEVLLAGNRVECVKIVTNINTGFVSGISWSTRFIDTTLVNGELHGGVDLSPSGIEFGWNGGYNSVEHTTTCNITINNHLINNCPENNPSTVCRVFEEPEFMGCPTPTEPAPLEPAPIEPVSIEPAPTEPAPTEPAPTEPAPTEPAPTEPATAIHFSTPTTLPSGEIAGIIAATTAGVYVLGSWGWAFYKGQRGTKFLLAPLSNIWQLVTSVTGQRCMGRDNNQAARDNQDEICPPLHQDQGQIIWPPPYTPRDAQESGQLIQLVDYSYAITRDPPPQYTERDPMPPPVYTESNPMVDPPPGCFPYSPDNEN